MLRNALKQREAREILGVASSGVGTGAIEGLFEGERDPLVELVVEGADAHVAASARAGRARSVQEIVGVGGRAQTSARAAGRVA